MTKPSAAQAIPALSRLMRRHNAPIRTCSAAGGGGEGAVHIGHDGRGNIVDVSKNSMS